MGVTQSGFVIDRDQPAIGAASAVSPRQIEVGERDARTTLRTQIGKLERECSAILANAFPNLSPADVPASGGEAWMARVCSRWKSWSGCATGWPAVAMTCAGLCRSV